MEANGWNKQYQAIQDGFVMKTGGFCVQVLSITIISECFVDVYGREVFYFPFQAQEVEAR